MMMTNKDYLDFIKSRYSRVLIRAIEYDLDHDSVLPAYDKIKLLELRAYLEKGN